MFSIKTLRHTFRTWTFLLYEDRHTVTPFHLDPGSSWSLTAVSTSGALRPLCSTSRLVEGLMFPNILYLRFTICTNGHLVAIVVRKPCHIRGLHCSYSSNIRFNVSSASINSLSISKPAKSTTGLYTCVSPKVCNIYYTIYSFLTYQ